MTKLTDLMETSPHSPYSIKEVRPSTFISQFANELYIVRSPKGEEIRIFTDFVDTLPFLKRQPHGSKVFRASDNVVLAFASSFKMTTSERKEYK